MVGAPLTGLFGDFVIFVCDYRGLDTGGMIKSDTSVHISPYSGKILDIANGRKWTRWNIGANSCGLIERSDGTAHVFMGNGKATGKIYDLLDVESFTSPANFGDDGTAIKSYFDTYYFIRPEQEALLQLGSHRKLFEYLTYFMEGQGTPTITLFPPGNYPGVVIPQSGIALPLLQSDDGLFSPAITAIQRNGNVVSVTTATNHNLSATSAAVIIGVSDATYNGVFGNLTITGLTTFTFPQVGANTGPFASGTVVPLIRDLELPINVETERIKIRVQTNAVGSWFSLRNLTLTMRTSPYSPVRGVPS